MESTGICTIAFLVLFPMLVALILLFVRNDKVRSVITVIGAAVIGCASVFLACVFIPSGPQKFAVDASVSTAIGYVTLLVDAALCVYIICKGLRHRKYLAVVLALVQLGLALYLDLAVADGIEATNALYVDNLSVIMSLIIGIVGSGIAIYALGYMRVHEAHNRDKDRRPIFFAVMFAFLGAMFAIVLCNDLAWMLCAWEITTVCSFALIGYTRTKEAIDNSFLQIVLNLIGGIAFTTGVILIGTFYGVMEFDRFLDYTLILSQTQFAVVTYLPVMLLALAAFTKAAQMPFQSWLLGAMVAPTPTSALLHSSTMVKAGVFLLIKLAPCLGFNLPGYLVMTVGGVTFLFCALAAISQSNAKRVLAYSTISNLGLICACAGIGTAGAIWAAIFLLIFHAVAKSLLFLCVGTAEHHIGSRNIEDMDDLFDRMPHLARLMALGIMGMFVAPFGMLVSKWAALEAFASSENIILIMLLVFGSAATFMFWAKWLGKILAIANSGEENVETTVSPSEKFSIGLMAVLTVDCCICFPLISSAVVVPYLQSVFSAVSSVISDGDLWIMAVIALVVAIILVSFTGRTKKKVVPVYMSGVGIDSSKRTFRNSFGVEEAATQRNWYMNDLFGEKKMKGIGIVVTLVLLAGAFGFAAQMAASNQSTFEEMSSAQQVYRQSVWSRTNNGNGFFGFLGTYEQQKAYYEQNKEVLKERFGIQDIAAYMDALYEQIYSGSDSSSSSSGGEE